MDDGSVSMMDYAALWKSINLLLSFVFLLVILSYVGVFFFFKPVILLFKYISIIVLFVSFISVQNKDIIFYLNF